MDKKNAWKVEPDLIDRFLDVLADKGFRWVTGPRAHEFRPCGDGDTILFIEKKGKRISYVWYSSYLKYLDKEYNITEVTNELLDEMESVGVANMEEGNMETLIRNVEQWAKEKGIADYNNWEKQFMKFQEEAFELYKEMVLWDRYREGELVYDDIDDKNDMKLEMGDVLVTLIVLAKQQDIELSDCLSLAWNKIKNRRGKTINGQFVKEEDLK